MAKYVVTHEDGRQTKVYAADETGAKKQANHAETSRVIIAGRRGIPHGPDASLAFSVEKLKD
jgi:hypothetical protein